MFTTFHFSIVQFRGYLSLRCNIWGRADTGDFLWPRFGCIECNQRSVTSGVIAPCWGGTNPNNNKHGVIKVGNCSLEVACLVTQGLRATACCVRCMLRAIPCCMPCVLFSAVASCIMCCCMLPRAVACCGVPMRALACRCVPSQRNRPHSNVPVIERGDKQTNIQRNLIPIPVNNLSLDMKRNSSNV